MSLGSPIRVRTVADQVCDRLRSELMAAEHAPGSPLREEELAARFGVSRHPIRKVLQQLTLEGLLASKPNCGVFVAESPAEHVRGLLTPMRVQLELYALRLAFPKLNPQHRLEWDAILKKMRQACDAKDVHGILDQDAAFHQHLLVVAGLESMISLWQAIYGRMREYHRQGNDTLVDLGVVAFVHVRMITSLFAGDERQAERDWQSHLENGAFNQRARRDWERENPQRTKPRSKR